MVLTEGSRRLSPFFAPMMLPNMAAAQVSLEFLGEPAGELMAVVALGYPAARTSGPKKLPLEALVRYLD